MTTVAELTPGDVVTHAGESATYIAQIQHPIWPHLRLVIWRLADDTWSHDALSARQDVGELERATAAERASALRGALLPPDPRHEHDPPPGWSAAKWSTMSRQQRRAATRRSQP